MRFSRHTIPNFLAALGRVLRWIFFRPEPLVVEPHVQDARLASCERCDRFIPDSRQCAECTCFVDVKTMLSTERCPLKRW